jgi:hypothetical protein
MGGGNSTQSNVTQIVDQKIINRNTLDSFNEQVTKSTTNSLMKTMTQAAASSSQNANVNIGRIVASGPGSNVSDLNININQEAVVSLEVADKSIQQNDINSELALAIINNVSSSINNEQMAKLVSGAESSQSVAGLSLAGGNESSSNAYNEMNSLTQNETARKFSNIITNVVNQTAQSENLKSCVTSDFKNASINIGEISATGGGNITNVGLTINQASSVISKCMFETEMVSNVSNSIAQTLGLTIKDETTNKQTSEGTATASAKQTITGLFDMGSILILVIIIVVIVIAVVLYFQFMKKRVSR